jgi:hypothetical protein
MYGNASSWASVAAGYIAESAARSMRPASRNGSSSDGRTRSRTRRAFAPHRPVTTRLDAGRSGGGRRCARRETGVLRQAGTSPRRGQRRVSARWERARPRDRFPSASRPSRRARRGLAGRPVEASRAATAPACSREATRPESRPRRPAGAQEVGGKAGRPRERRRRSRRAQRYGGDIAALRPPDLPALGERGGVVPVAIRGDSGIGRKVVHGVTLTTARRRLALRLPDRLGPAQPKEGPQTRPLPHALRGRAVLGGRRDDGRAAASSASLPRRSLEPD